MLRIEDGNDTISKKERMVEAYAGPSFSFLTHCILEYSI